MSGRIPPTMDEANHTMPLEVPAAAPARRSIYSLLATAWFFGKWKAETHNERLQQEIMEREGWWPIADEADLLAKVEAELSQPRSRARAAMLERELNNAGSLLARCVLAADSGTYRDRAELSIAMHPAFEDARNWLAAQAAAQPQEPK